MTPRGWVCTFLAVGLAFAAPFVVPGIASTDSKGVMPNERHRTSISRESAAPEQHLAGAANDRAYIARIAVLHATAVRYRRQRDDLQHRLTIRVLETRRLTTALKRGTDATLYHPLERSFLCIHRFEGPWNARTGNGYYGGMQMDLTFQRTYGPEFLRWFGTADRWPPSVQLAVSIKAYLSGRGFFPWPNTARACGLIR